MRTPAATRLPSADLLRRYLPVTPVPSLPELRLHLAGPRSGLGRLLAADAAGRPPYWAHVWGGGLVLARYLLDRPGLVAGRRVLDLGCGSGLVAIAAALGGARAVRAVDVDPVAGVATALNAALNGVAVAVEVADLLEGPVPPVDVLLAGDLFYDAAFAPRVATFLGRAAAAGCLVLVGDPGRAPLPRSRLAVIHTGPAPDFAGGSDPRPCAVYRYLAPSDRSVMDEVCPPAGP